MHWYKFHIGDYIRDTSHLSNEEDLAYRRLLDLYYLQNGVIPNETQSVSRRLRLDTEVVSRVLQEFFCFNENTWKHKRCDMELREYKAICDRNASNGKLGGRPKKTQMVSSGNPDETQWKATGKPTKNQEPLTINQEETKTLSVCTDDVVKVIDHLNNVTGSRFKTVDANVRLIKARIKESSAEDCISVINKKAEEWTGDMRQYLRPSTLFSAKNFASYLGAATESFNVQEYCNAA